MDLRQYPLSPKQLLFARLLHGCAPYLVGYWDFSSKQCDVDRLQDEIEALPRGEQIMAQFFLAVWFGRGYEIDLIEAAKVLNDEQRDVVAGWLRSPLWPNRE